jgi:hypothetical protein
MPLVLDSVTRNGLVALQDVLSGYTGTVVVDDLGKVDTLFSRVSTVVTFAELVYSHFVNKHTGVTHLDIRDFNGAAVLNIQPGILEALVQADEWEANLRDKVIRYYHLYRPVEPRQDGFSVKVDWGLPVTEVKPPNLDKAGLEMLLQGQIPPWSRARTPEHLKALLQAAAALDGRDRVNRSDYQVVARLLRPVLVETQLVYKDHLEGKAQLDALAVYLLGEFASYPRLTLRDLALDFCLSTVQAARVMAQATKWARLERQSEISFRPSSAMETLLQIADVYRYGGVGKHAKRSRTASKRSQES